MRKWYTVVLAFGGVSQTRKGFSIRSFPVLFVAYCLGFTVAASAQVIPGEEDFTDDIGRLGNVDERFAHDACDTCFTAPGLPDNSYHIFQSITVDGAEQIIPRSIPNPTPLADDAEPRETVDPDSGQPVWYIGDQAYVGPTDKEPFSRLYKVPLIDLKIIHRQNIDAVLGVQGVHGFGIGKTGFNVSVLPDAAVLAKAALPTVIDGVPVTVNAKPRPQLIRHDHVHFRPIPTGAGMSVLLIDGKAATPAHSHGRGDECAVGGKRRSGVQWAGYAWPAYRADGTERGVLLPDMGAHSQPCCQEHG